MDEVSKDGSHRYRSWLESLRQLPEVGCRPRVSGCRIVSALTTHSSPTRKPSARRAAASPTWTSPGSPPRPPGRARCLAAGWTGRALDDGHDVGQLPAANRGQRRHLRHQGTRGPGDRRTARAGRLPPRDRRRRRERASRAPARDGLVHRPIGADLGHTGYLSGLHPAVRAASSAWPRTSTSRRGRGGSAAVPSATLPPAGRSSSRTPAIPPSSRPAMAFIAWGSIDDARHALDRWKRTTRTTVARRVSWRSRSSLPRRCLATYWTARVSVDGAGAVPGRLGPLDPSGEHPHRVGLLPRGQASVRQGQERTRPVSAAGCMVSTSTHGRPSTSSRLGTSRSEIGLSWSARSSCARSVSMSGGMS